MDQSNGIGLIGTFCFGSMNEDNSGIGFITGFCFCCTGSNRGIGFIVNIYIVNTLAKYYK